MDSGLARYAHAADLAARRGAAPLERAIRARLELYRADSSYVE